MCNVMGIWGALGWEGRDPGTEEDKEKIAQNIRKENRVDGGRGSGSLDSSCPKAIMLACLHPILLKYTSTCPPLGVLGF